MQRSLLTLLSTLSLLGSNAHAQLELTLLHANDGESALTGYGPEGGAHRFVEVIRRERARSLDTPVLTISTGDTYLAGRQLEASLRALETDPQSAIFYDAAVTRAMHYDAIVIGNHEFDFGPRLLSTFIERVTDGELSPVFLSANLDFSASEQVSPTARDHIQPAATFDFGSARVGVVAATTPLVTAISSTGDVVVNTDLVGILQREIDRLQADDVNIIILASHLQSVAADAALIAQLRGVDFAIAGGGDELLANEDTLLVPSHEDEVIAGPYPLTQLDLDGDGEAEVIRNADGIPVPVVTTSGQYRYLGRITLRFDADGQLAGFHNASPVRVIDASLNTSNATISDGVRGDATMNRFLLDPVRAFSASLDEQVVATLGSEVSLVGRRTEVRTRETGMGNLIADALRWKMMELYDITQPVIGLQNAGGIRNDVVLGPGSTMTMGHTFDALPFPNFVSLIRDVDVQTLKRTLENAVSRVERGDGRFLQVSGLRFTYDPSRPARRYDSAGRVVQEGSRVQSVWLADGTQLIADGQVISDQRIAVATNDFTANGGDQHDFGPFAEGRYSRSGISYQQAVAGYIASLTGGAGVLTGAAYAEHGEGRITRLPGQ